MSIIESIGNAVFKGKAKEVVTLVQEALAEGILAGEILEQGLLKGMSELGEKFKNNEVFVPEVLVAARALNKGTEIIKTKLLEEGVEPIGRAVICTVKGDLHDIGKNLVKMMMEGSGFEMIDLKVDVPEDKIVETVKAEKPQIVLLSALLTTTMNECEVVIKALEDAGIRDEVKVMVGGAPLTQTFADSIGADGYAPDAASAAEMAKAYVQ